MTVSDLPDYTTWINGDVGITGTVTITGAVIVTGIVAILGTVTVTGAVIVTGTVAISGTVTVTGAVTVTGSVTVSGSVSILGTVTVSGTVAISGTVTVTGTVIVSGTVAISGSVTVTGTVAISGSVTVTGTVAISGTVTITGAVTITGSVTITSGAVTISTAAGTNIVLDLLKTSAYTEVRNTLANDNGVVAPNAPPLNYSGQNYIDKFFSRGCRGLLNYLQVYCHNAAAGAITLNVSPNIGDPAIITVTFTPATGWSWAQSPWIGKAWNYDTMWIWASANSADVAVGYELAAPHDNYIINSSGVPSDIAPQRFYLRAIITGQSVGDVGAHVVNNIEIPNAVSTRLRASLAVPKLTELLDTIQYGSGKTLFVMFFTSNEDGSRSLAPRIYVDGVSILPIDNAMSIWYSTYLQLSQEGMFIGEWNTTDKRYCVVVALRIPFKRSLQIGFYNADGVNAYTGEVSYIYEKLS